ncbi:MAG: AmmeMemoRadiSam system radical SAM enzyme [Candidatus Aminicenantes bacterium]|nr:AmmeMemoRadiSam system radical SAM enzyme [Candidatus Aminicenantes bacterium]
MIKEAKLYRALQGNKVSCFLCNHRCEIVDSKFGICGVRQNKKGKLYTHVFGEVIAAHIDPIEKKPLYHFLPGTTSFSIATIGCNFRCPFCQNWQISQASKRKETGLSDQKLLPQEVVDRAKNHGCQSISYTYTEPTIFFEYAYETAKLAAEEGLANIFVTNGYMTAEALETIKPYLNACNVDLKSFREKFYKEICQGRLQPVLDSIRLMKKLNIWVEVTTLVVPGVNDGEEELRDIARFIAETDPNIPWHISRFHPSYEYTNTYSTPIETLRMALSIGEKEGLRYIYIGNVMGESENTLCPSCGKTVIQRQGFFTSTNKVKDSKCSFCGNPISGIF